MELSQQRLKELLNYDPETGDFTWKVQTNNRIKIGMVAGTNTEGYIQITIDKKIYKAHRLAFLFMTGGFPGGEMQVDHTNHIRNDNRWENLRIVTPQDNNKNRSMGIYNSSGRVGVYWHKAAKKWTSRIKINGKEKYLGLFDDKNDAIAAREVAETKYGFHPNHGRGEVRMVNVTVIPS